MIKRLLGKTFTRWYSRLMRNTKYRWIVLLGSLLYVVSPLDISPDVFPVVGWIDDGLIATLAVAEISQMLQERRRRQSTQAATSAPGVAEPAPASPSWDAAPPWRR